MLPASTPEVLVVTASPPGACQRGTRVLLGALIAAATTTHLVLLGMLRLEQSGYQDKSMVYCEVDDDDNWSPSQNPLGPASSSSAEGTAVCSGGFPGMIPDAGESYAIVGSFEWKMTHVLAHNCKVFGSQLARGAGGDDRRQPMLCPVDMQIATKQQGRCKVPPTACHCVRTDPENSGSHTAVCSSVPKEDKQHYYNPSGQ